MNTKGQGLLSALVVIMILGIAMEAATQLLVGLQRQQAALVRKTNWTALRTNINNLLENPTSCNNTVLTWTGSTIEIQDIAGNKFAAVGDVIAPQFTISSANLAPIPINPSSKSQCSNQGKSSSASGSSCANSGNSNVAQGLLTITGTYKKTGETLRAQYVVNLTTSASNQVTGCLFN